MSETRNLSKKNNLVTEGVKINEEGGRLFETTSYLLPGNVDLLKYKADIGKIDLDIIRSALVLQHYNPDIPVEIVSFDNNLISIARANGMTANLKTKDEIQIDKIDNKININKDKLIFRYIKKERKKIKSNERLTINKETLKKFGINVNELYHNKYFYFKQKGPKELDFNFLFKYDINENALISTDFNFEHSIAGIKPKNLEQAVLIDSIMSPGNSVIVVDGTAGTGKTLLSLACGLEIIAAERLYKENPDAKIYITRTRDPVGGRELYAVPGDRNEKNFELYKGVEKNIPKIMKEWKILDEVEKVIKKKQGEIISEASGTTKSKRGKKKKKIKSIYATAPQFGSTLHDLVGDDLIELLDIGTIRGTDFSPGEIYYIDEAQNLTPYEIKTALTRVGEGSKLIISGDSSQVDNPKCSQEYNGLVHIISKIAKRNDPKYNFASTVTLIKSERSIVAEFGTKFL